MRGMLTRQATRLFILLALLFGTFACTPQPTPPPPTATPLPPTATVTPLPRVPTPTATPLTCLSQPGSLDRGEIPTQGVPTSFIVYLPPCYDHFADQRYPVVYLLNGIAIPTDPFPVGEQWLQIGAATAADELIHAGDAAPFIIVLPEDRYWYTQQGAYFGQFLINDIIPYIDSHYRTVSDRSHRALGGLSRGGGWALEIGLTRWDLFGSIGLHSPAIRSEDAPNLETWIRDIPLDQWPRLSIDLGDNDRERGTTTQLEDLLSRYQVPHEWHLNQGEHDMVYWSAHVKEYMQWYADGFQ